MSVTLHTSHGDIKIEIFCDLVNKAAKNFMALCASNYYNNTIFHRNIKGFILQGGDPTGTGKGGKSIYGNFFDDEIVDILRHDKRGIVSMANAGPGTNGSQFFITYNKHPTLDNVNTVFGKVIYGFETLDSIENAAVDTKFRPMQPIKILSVTIHANPIADSEI